MFLAWNYALESFLWILVGAIILVSLTILLAGPQFRSKKSETSEEALSLIMSSPFETLTFFLSGLLTLLVSGDLYHIWNYYKNRVTNLPKNNGN